MVRTILVIVALKIAMEATAVAFPAPPCMDCPPLVADCRQLQQEMDGLQVEIDVINNEIEQLQVSITLMLALTGDWESVRAMVNYLDYLREQRDIKQTTMVYFEILLADKLDELADCPICVQ